MRFDYRFCDAQAQTETVIRASGPRNLIKPVEYIRQFILRYAYARIGDFRQDERVFFCSGYTYRAIFGRIFNSVIKQVKQRLSHASLVSFDLGQVVGDIQPYIYGFAGGRRKKAF